MFPRFFFIISRICLALTLLLAWLAPANYAYATTCETTETGWECSINIQVYGEGPRFTFTISEDQTAVEIITYTSLTCNDHGTGQGTDEYAADPYLKLYDDGGTLLFEDDDMAPHNDGQNLCWDSYLSVTLNSGDYELWSTAYSEDTIGVYTLEFTGGVWNIEDPEPTPTPDIPEEVPEPTPEPEPSPTPIPDEPDEPDPLPTPTPDEVPEETPQPTPDETPPVEDPAPSPEPTPEITPEPIPVQPTPPPIIISPIPIPEPSPEQLPEISQPDLPEDSIIWDWDDWDFDELEIEQEQLDEELVFESLEPEEELVDLEELEPLEFEDDEPGEEEIVEELPELELFEYEEDELIIEELEEEELETYLEGPPDEENIYFDEETGEWEDDPDLELEEVDAEDLLEDEEALEELIDELEEDDVLEEILQDNENFFEDASDEDLGTLFEKEPEIFIQASDSTKEDFQEEVNVFSGDFEDYVASGQTITIEERRTVVAATTAISTVAVASRPTAGPQPGPRQAGPSGGPISGPSSRKNR